MQVSLLNLVVCPYCHAQLTEHVAVYGEEARGGVAVIKEGILTCNSCQKWYPILNYIPELLPDYLRKWDRDAGFLHSLDGRISGDIINSLVASGKVDAWNDNGFKYKSSEINITSKISDSQSFFGPGYCSPFNRYNPEYTVQLIRRFGNVVPFLGMKADDVVLDICAGYAWTTEWLMRMGMQAIGVDICRTYLDVGVARMGKSRPHLLVADIENLPLKDCSLNSVLCYDAFHHIPDRKRGMAQFHRTLKPQGAVVLAEPGGEHEHHPAVIDVMETYGILLTVTDFGGVGFGSHPGTRTPTGFAASSHGSDGG